MRKIIVYIATSTDGFIARRNGSVDWLDRPQIKGSYGMTEFYRSIDTVLWGRKTYDMALGFKADGKAGTESDSKVKNYVFSRRPPRKPVAGAEFVKEPISEFAQRLRSLAGKDIWMMGGAGIIGSFLDEDAIDEFIIHVVPTLIGEGIPLACRSFSDGVVRLHYAVDRGKTRKASKKESA